MVWLAAVRLFGWRLMLFVIVVLFVCVLWVFYLVVFGAVNEMRLWLFVY